MNKGRARWKGPRRDPRIKGWWVGAIVVAVLACSPTQGDTQAPEVKRNFEGGITAFRGGHYREALEKFLAAREAGMASLALTYNLAMTYYRLGRYDAARAELAQLARNKEATALAHYNLGLIALKQEDAPAARKHFLEVLTTAGRELRSLAERALVRVDQRLSPTRWRELVASAIGHDDNVALAPDADLVGVSDEEDTFVDLLAGATRRLSGTQEKGFRLDLDGYVRDYSEINRFDQVVVRFGAAYDHRRDVWQTALAGHGLLAYLDGERFQRIAAMTVEAVRPLSHRRTLRLHGRISQIDAAGEFDHLTGRRGQFRAEVALPWKRGDARLGYEVELNDRRDLVQGQEFFSQSPTRQNLYFALAWSFGRLWELHSRAEYRRSIFEDPDLVLTQTGIVRERRRDDRFLVSLRADRELRKRWRLFGEYTYTDNDSNFAEFDYIRNEVKIGLERMF